jgi:hypothetical protein
MFLKIWTQKRPLCLEVIRSQHHSDQQLNYPLFYSNSEKFPNIFKMVLWLTRRIQIKTFLNTFVGGRFFNMCATGRCVKEDEKIAERTGAAVAALKLLLESGFYDKRMSKQRH